MRHALLLTALTLAACSMGRDVPAATAAAGRFHQALNAGQFAAIYASAGSDFKTAATDTSFSALASAVHRKLGLFRSARTTGWRENVNTGGTVVDLALATHYDRGDAIEQFVFQMHDGHATLAGWHINSDALILN